MRRAAVWRCGLGAASILAAAAITAGCRDGGDDYGNPHEAPESVAVLPSNLTLVVGTTYRLAAVGRFADGHLEDLTDESTWSSSSAGVASVDAAGLATANTTGSATITAEHDGVSGTGTLTVTTGS